MANKKQRGKRVLVVEQKVSKKKSSQKKSSSKKEQVVKEKKHRTRVKAHAVSDRIVVSHRLTNAKTQVRTSHLELAKAVALPLGNAARLPDPFGAVCTGASTPFEVSTFDFSDTPVAGMQYGFAGGGFFAAVSRDCLNAFIVSIHNPLLLPWDYVGSFSSYSGPTYADAVIGRTAKIAVAGPVTPDLQFMRPGGVQFQAYGPIQYAKSVATRDTNAASLRFIWIDADTVRTSSMIFTFYDDAGATVPAVQGASIGDVNVYRYTGSRAQVVYMSAITFAAPGCTTFVGITTPGYYAFNLEMNDTLQSPLYLTFVVGTSTATAVTFAHLPIQDLDLRGADYEEVRVIGKSLMLSPYAVEMAKGGIVAGLQIPASEMVTSLIPMDPTVGAADHIMDREGATRLDFSKGMYAFHKPDGEDNFAFQQPFGYTPTSIHTNASRPVVATYNAAMHPAGGWLVMACTVPANSFAGSIPFPGGQVRVTVCESLEFRTTSLWYTLSSPPLHVMSIDEVMYLIRNVPQFDENPLHWKDITSWLSRNASVIKRVAGAASAGFSLLFPEAAPVIAGANSFIQGL